MGLRAYLIRYFAATSDSRQYSTSAAGAFPSHDATPREYLESHSESRKKNPFVSKLLSSWAHEPATSASPSQLQPVGKVREQTPSMATSSISPPTTYAPQHSSTTLVAQSFVCAPSMVVKDGQTTGAGGGGDGGGDADGGGGG